MDSRGDVVNLTTYDSKVVLVAFWAIWHASSAAPMAGMQTLHEQYDDNDAVAIVGVHKDVDYRKGNPVDYMAENGYTFDLIPDGRNVAEAYGIWSLPQFVVIDGEGEVIHRQTGFGPDDIDAFSEIIDGALAEERTSG